VDFIKFVFDKALLNGITLIKCYTGVIYLYIYIWWGDAPRSIALNLQLTIHVHIPNIVSTQIIIAIFVGTY
jgi:hypothetical protein